MSDPIFESIRRGHQEEIDAEMQEMAQRREKQDIKDAIDDISHIRLYADFASQSSEQSIEILQAINANLYEQHNTQKDIRTYLKFIMYGVVIITIAVVDQLWF